MRIETKVQIGNRNYVADLTKGSSLAIPLNFDGRQPNHFRAPLARREPLKMNGFVGDTRQGGSCNVDQLICTPHCNGTHTESIGHIVNEQVPIQNVSPRGHLIAELISIAPITLEGSRESYGPEAQGSDFVICSRSIRDARKLNLEALIIRTFPNAAEKKWRVYNAESQPAYLTFEACRELVASGVEHLLIDLPSIDRMHDGGYLYNHHCYWNVEIGSRQLQSTSRRNATISEMIFIDDQLHDGLYLLSLSIPPFLSDAAPSDPIIYPLGEVNA